MVRKTVVTNMTIDGRRAAESSKTVAKGLENEDDKQREAGAAETTAVTGRGASEPPAFKKRGAFSKGRNFRRRGNSLERKGRYTSIN